MLFNATPYGDQRLSAITLPIFQKKSSEERGSFLYYHWLEAKERISYLLLSFTITLSICYLYSLELVFLYVKPFLSLERSFIFTELTEAFYVTLGICLTIAFSLLLPLFCYQAWCFLVPSFYNLERKGWSLSLSISTLLSLLAILSVYSLVLPEIAALLLQFEIKSQVLTIQLEARITSYVNWSFKIFVAVLIYGQLPFLSYIAVHSGLLTPQGLIRKRRVFLAFSLLMAALLSPPDLILQWLATLSMLCWIEAVIWLGMIYQRGNMRRVACCS